MNSDIRNTLYQKLSEMIDVSRNEVFLSKAPGRIEILGNHTDYNSGMVLSATIDRYIWTIGTQTDDIVMQSIDMNDTQSFDSNDLMLDSSNSWSKYAKGVLWAFGRRRHNIKNFTTVIKGNVPIGGGLSSSAALEVSLVNLIKEISGLNLHPKAAAMLAFEAERLFCGISCGVMDQFSSQLCKADSLLGINCMNLQTYDISFQFDASFVVIDSMISREAGNALNMRRVECTEALKTLQNNGWEINNLSSITPDSLDNALAVLDDPSANRVQHVVQENARVQEATKVIRDGNLSAFGNLMKESHTSSRDLYQVSHPNLDLLVDIASAQEGTFGSRMSGAGFGGNVIALVKSQHIHQFKERVSKEYESQMGTVPNIVAVSIPGGVQTQRI